MVGFSVVLRGYICIEGFFLMIVDIFFFYYIVNEYNSG